ncbi:MAG: MBL fold metallo-hydrolase [Pseudomonadota bacterium]
MKRIFEVSVPQGGVAFALLNTYSTIVIKTDSLTALFDPVKIKLKEEDGIDLIIITHEHSDHFEQNLVLDLQKEKNAVVLTTPFLAHMLGDLGGYVKSLRVGDSFKKKDAFFYAEYSNHPGNQPLSFVIGTKGINIYHPNDSRPFPEMTLIKRRFRPELMLYTGNGLGDIPEIAGMISPKVVVSYSDPRFKEMKIAGVEIKMLDQGEVYLFSPSP